MMNNDMNGEHTQDTYLADWLSGKLSDEQLSQLVSDEDFAEYAKIRDSIGRYNIEGADMDMNYAKIRQQIDAKKGGKKSKVIQLFQYVAVAAALLMFFGLYQLFAYANTSTAAVGTISSIKLDDGSSVNLNTKSAISYPNLFTYNRTIKLNGEAFFNVTKGSSFCVKTHAGMVEVLGTKFNVIARQNFFEVICYEGKVKVSSNNQDFILQKGDGIRFHDDEVETMIESQHSQPTWLSGESTFRNVPFQFVVEQLENQYGYDVQFPAHLNNKKFSGTFPNHDVEMALQSVCLPLGLKNSIASDSTIIISE
ncbi:MAG TPA: FecR domain-containing protein [Flavobacterium sp.]|jgi:ferric-dicitrate binding protein FerR (iron transport regulator)|nr:FecR domain-containing protein [Flavobacterium sp.]